MNLFVEKLNDALRRNNSFLCVGLDTDFNLIPFKSKNVFKSILKFNKNIIEATKDLVCCYKINSAFYEAYGIEGIKALQKTVEFINEIPVILDAKRSDIGNSAKYYAKFGFEYINADAMTIIPYMGIDTIDVFRDYKEKFVFVVIVSSNPGAKDFQEFPDKKNPVYLKIMKKCKITDKYNNTGYVIGATYPEKIKYIRSRGFNEIFLIPGIGAQKGDAEKSIKYAFMKKGKGIFNVSRAIIYQSDKKNYFKNVRKKAEYYKDLFNSLKQK